MMVNLLYVGPSIYLNSRLVMVTILQKRQCSQTGFSEKASLGGNRPQAILNAKESLLENFFTLAHL